MHARERNFVEEYLIIPINSSATIAVAIVEVHLYWLCQLESLPSAVQVIAQFLHLAIGHQFFAEVGMHC